MFAKWINHSVLNSLATGQRRRSPFPFNNFRMDIRHIVRSWPKWDFPQNRTDAERVI